MKRTAQQAFRSVGLRIWSVLFATLRQRNDAQAAALKTLASTGRVPRRDDGPLTKREQRQFWSQVCVTCGRGVPPGRPGRTCEACRNPTPTATPRSA